MRNLSTHRSVGAVVGKTPVLVLINRGDAGVQRNIHSMHRIYYQLGLHSQVTVGRAGVDKTPLRAGATTGHLGVPTGLRRDVSEVAGALVLDRVVPVG